MANEGKWIAVAVGAFFLLGGMSKKAMASSSGIPIGNVPVGTRPASEGFLAGFFSGNTGGTHPVNVNAEPILPGINIAAGSGDEDIGIHPVPGIAAPVPQPGVVVVPDSNTPVIDQLPIFTVTGSNEAGFTLTAPEANFENFTGSTNIRVEGFGDQNPDFNFATQPDVLKAYLEQF